MPNNYSSEYIRYKKLLESSIGQVDDVDLFKKLSPQSNSIGIILNHISGNLISRFTNFLKSDGEKDWRNRETEFSDEKLNRHALIEKWEKAWAILEKSTFSLSKEQMEETVSIRGVQLTVEEALTRSLSHFSYHVGEIVFLAKHFAGDKWEYLSIPPGESAKYNNSPTNEKAT